MRGGTLAPVASFRIDADFTETFADLGALEGRQARLAIARALNRTLGGVKTSTSQEIRSELNLKDKDVKRDLSVRRAAVGGTSPKARIVIAGSPAPLSRFGAKQTRSGLSVKIKRTGGRTKLKRAFLVATGGEGQRRAFERSGRKRLPIEQLFSTAPAQLMNDQERVDRVGAKARDRFVRELVRESAFRRGRR